MKRLWEHTQILIMVILLGLWLNLVAIAAEQHRANLILAASAERQSK